jgi:hypothetical protein
MKTGKNIDSARGMIVRGDGYNCLVQGVDNNISSG